MEDNQDNLACTPPETRETDKNTVKFFHWTLPVLTCIKLYQPKNVRKML
jgi:hypothetical protein